MAQGVCGDIESLLSSASSIYQEVTGEPASPRTLLGEVVAKQYRGLLGNFTPETLTQWADSRPEFGEVLKKKRNESVFFRDSIVILLGALVSENETAIPKTWPLDSSHLEELYISLGLSTNGLF